MSEKPKTYAETVAPEPLYRDDVPNTADNVLRWIAVDGLDAEAGKLWLLPHKGEPDFEVKFLRWQIAFLRMTGAFNLHLTLSRLRQVDPTAADDIADWIVSAYEGGDSYGEFLYQWVSEAGLDADRIVTEAKAESKPGGAA